MSALSIRGVRKRFGGNEILKGIDIAIDPGQFLILVGPSGCGKSTLLNCIAGLETVSEGEIWIGGRCVNDVAPAARDIAMVFQSYALYPNMRIRENIAFGLEMRKVPKAERDAIVERVAKMLQIEPLLDRKPSQLSGGQRQRVAMGRALARNPILFLFDEPLSNLDAKLRVEMRAEIKMLHQRLKTTIVYVTHDQVEAMTLADRIAVMKDGEVQQSGTPGEIYGQPANTFVAGFIGSPSMNLLPGRISADGHSVELSAGADRIALPVPRATLAGREVLLGIRPENIAVASEGEPAVAAAIRMIEPTGPDLMVTFECARQAVVARLPARTRISAGEPVRIGFDATAAVLFDPATGRNLGAGH